MYAYVVTNYPEKAVVLEDEDYESEKTYMSRKSYFCVHISYHELRRGIWNSSMPRKA